MLLSAEITSDKVVNSVNSYCVPNYHNSKTSPLAVAIRLSKHCKNITYTMVCRSHKTLASVRKALSEVARVREIRTILAVTGDKAADGDVNVFDLISSIDKKRFKVSSAIVFTRNGEERRIARKSAAGATIYCTQPVFPENSYKLLSLLKRLQLQCEVRIGVLIPFSSPVCRKIAKEKPDFISGTKFIATLAAAEAKSAKAACAATIRIARENLKAAMNVAEAINSGRGNKCKITGIHFYGLSDRVFDTGKGQIKIAAASLFKEATQKAQL